MDITSTKIVSAHVWNPANSLFKQPKNAKAECTTISCALESCPVRDAKACLYAPVIGRPRCPYGTVRTETGPTRRSASFSKWIRERKDRYEGIGKLGYPAKKMAIIGDYIYLPYAHMTMCKAVPFLSHDSMFVSGSALISLSSWTIDTAVTLIDFRPRTYLDTREIAEYQQKSVPLFLTHLRECDPEMWMQLVALRPELDKPANHVGRKALLRTLKPDIAWTTSGGHKSEYPVTWRWDGVSVRTTSIHAYNDTWGDLKLEDMEIVATPAENAAITVLANEWVILRTIFVD